MPIGQDTFYCDLDSGMAINEISHDFILKKNNFSVKQSVRQLLKYHFYDKIWDPNCGSYFPVMLFTQNAPEWLNVAKESILNILNRYEPRINVKKVLMDSTDEGSVSIRIEYEIIATSARDTYSFTVNRLR